MNHRPAVRSLTALLGALLLAGCAGMHSGESVSPTITIGSMPDGSVRVDTDDERLAEHWEAAERARRDGDDAEALEALYQGLDIDPRNSLFWSRAAEIQLDNNEPAQAENFAAKSNVFAGENTALLHRNWLIIEHARDMRGDLLGVRSAHRKVQQYQYR